MKQKLYLVIVLGLVLVSTVGNAEPRRWAPPRVAAKVAPVRLSALSVVAGGGANVLSYPNGPTDVDNRISWMATLTANYFFNSSFGIFTGAQTSARGFNTTLGTGATAPFVDVPFGFVLNTTGSLYSPTRSLVRAGGFYAIPVASDFEGDANLSAIGTKTQGYLGLYLDHQTTFAVSDTIALGYTIWGKLPLSSGVSTSGAAFYEAGVGFVLELR